MFCMRQTSVFVRFLTPEERQPMEAGLRSAAAFLVRRCQSVRASEYGAGVPRIARQVGCSAQTVRTVVPAFTTQGGAGLPRGSSRPHPTRARLGSEGAQRLQAWLPQSPRTCGHPTSLGTLELAAAVSLAHGRTPQRVSRAALRTALRRLEVSGQRAQHWITSPDPAYARKKKPVTACSAWQQATRRGRWAVQRSRGGVAWRSPRGLPGRPHGRPGAWSSKPGPLPLLTPKP